MNTGLDINAPLPAIRDELQIMQTRPEVSGASSWVIYDPIRHRYFQIDGQVVRLLRHWSKGSARELLEQKDASDTTLEDIETLVKFLFANGLTVEPPQGDSANFVQQANASRRGAISALLHNYLFFRIPLIRPQRFLHALNGIAEIFFQRSWWVFLFCLLLISGYLSLRQLDAFAHTFMHFFNAKGLVFYGMALVVVKIIHELGHAFAATRYGCRVATMGVAFLVMFPVLYTDTTDSWRLTDRKKRLVIDGAGIAAELMVAIFATLAWALLPEGPLRSASFFLATTSWALSLAVNLNPLMRFDGYHFFSDVIGVQNLQARAFALGRWNLRERLFSFNAPAPEAVSHRMQRLLITFSYACWVYRFFLFIGIGLLVHALFPKPLGGFLFIVEIAFFIGKPVIDEICVWIKTLKEQEFTTKTAITGIVFSVLIICCFIPLPSTIRVPAIIEADQVEIAHAPSAAQVVEINMAIGDHAEAGSAVLTLRSPQLEIERDLVRKKLDLINLKIRRIAVESQSRDQRLVYLQERQQLRRQLKGIEQELSRLSITASFNSTVRELLPNLRSGRWINEEMPIVVMRKNDDVRGRGYVAGDNSTEIHEGSAAIFVSDALEIRKLRGKVDSIVTSSAEGISIMSLDSRYGGPIAVSENGKPLKSWHPVSFTFPNSDWSTDYQMRGEIHIAGPRRSFVENVWRRLLIVGVRETTF